MVWLKTCSSKHYLPTDIIYKIAIMCAPLHTYSSVISPGYNPLNHPLDPFNLKFLLLTLDISSFLAQRLPTVIINLKNESRFCHCRSSHCTTGLNVRELASVSWSDTFFYLLSRFLNRVWSD